MAHHKFINFHFSPPEHHNASSAFLIAFLRDKFETDSRGIGDHAAECDEHIPNVNNFS